MVPKIDFKDGIITYDNLFWLFNDTNGLINKLEFEEDLLQVQFFNEKYILEWHDFVIELQEQLMKMTDESYSKKINLFVLQSFFVEPYDMQTDFYIQFENRLAKTKTVIRQLQKGQK